MNSIKSVVLSAFLVGSSLAMADQRPETEVRCGRLKFKYQECFTTPCPQPLYLYGRAGSTPVELVDGGNLQAQLEALDGKAVCVRGYEYADGSFSVLEILP